MDQINAEISGQDLIKVITSEEFPKFYANGFVNFLGNADVGVIFQYNGKPNMAVNMSFTLAKTLVEKLNQMMVEFEDKTGTKIMTTNVVDEKIQQKN